MQYEFDRINIVILAGGINRIELFKGYAPGYKALLPIRGKPLIEYTLDSLHRVTRISRICIIGPQEVKERIHDPGRYEFVPAKETLLENVVSGLELFKDSRVVLFVPSDLPLVTAQSINDFIKACGHVKTSYPANFFWAMVPEESFVGPYAEVKKGFNRFRDVSVCHGNLFLADTALLSNRTFSSLVNKAYRSRKSSIRTALTIGPVVGLSYLIGVHAFRILSMRQLARIASFHFGAGMIPILLRRPEIAVDVDEPRDYEFVLGQLG